MEIHLFLCLQVKASAGLLRFQCLWSQGNWRLTTRVPLSQGALTLWSCVVFWKRKLNLESEIQDLSLISVSTLLCGHGHIVSLWAFVSSSLKWESRPLRKPQWFCEDRIMMMCWNLRGLHVRCLLLLICARFHEFPQIIGFLECYTPGSTWNTGHSYHNVRLSLIYRKYYVARISNTS